MERITNKQFAQQIEEYLNQSNRTGDYEQVAMEWSETMHRYLQNEGWKLLKQIVKAVAQARYDGRNDRAHEEAAKVYEYMRDMHMM